MLVVAEMYLMNGALSSSLFSCKL